MIAKADLERMKAVGMSQRAIANMMKCSQSNVRHWQKVHGIYFERSAPAPCAVCGNIRNRRVGKYCSRQCWQEQRFQSYIDKWKAGVVDGGTSDEDASRYVRRYIWKKYEGKCAVCGWCEIHPATGKPPLQIDHQNGDGGDHSEENLILLCPNHHALTLTFGGRNRGNGRKTRRARYRRVGT